MPQTTFWDFAEKIAVPLIVAAIAYMMGRKQLINSRVTQFRQRWIDDLRNAISLFITEAEIISMIDMDDDEQYFQHFRELSQMSFKITLMLNPIEEEHKLLTECIEKIKDVIHDDKITDKKLDRTLNKYIEELLVVSKQVLKKEWLRVKSNK